MNKRTANTNFAPEAGSFGAGILIGLSIVGPVFAATDEMTGDWSLWLMGGSILLLLIGLALKAISVSRARKLMLSEPVSDMRRDRVADEAVDHSFTLAAVPGRHIH